jgi:phage terminase large subunit GpA-like protein
MALTDRYTFASAAGLVKNVSKALRPPPDLSLSDWSEEYRRLSAESSASPGKFNLDRTPYMREPMDMIGTPGVTSVALMTSAQVGKSTLIENIIGYFIHLDPCPILHISPTLDSMKMFSKERLAPMVRDTPVLRGLVREARTRDSGNTIGSKRFPGGHIAMVGSNSPSGLASRPIRVLVADEVDRFERSAGTEGDPLKLGIKRTTTFWNRIKAYVSTPGDKYDPKEQTGSRIEREFLEGDQRHYHCKCPHCDHEQKMRWANVHWEEDKPETAQYMCEECGSLWDDLERYTAIANGRWIAEKPFNGRVSYHLSQLCSMFTKLEDGVRDFLESKGDPMLLKTWVNTFLGEPWENKGERLEWSNLRDQREEYDIGENFPEEVTVLTMAVDTQDDRLETELVGWADDHQTWSLRYHTIYGDLSTPEPWDELDELTTQTFMHPLFGEIKIRATVVDSGGHYTQRVYDFCEHRHGVVAIKGVSGEDRPFVGRPMKNTIGNHRVFPLGVDSIKKTVVGRLRVRDWDKAGYCRFPMEYDDDYFRMLTAEEMRVKFRRGFKVKEWVKIRNRNEAFDLRVYNTAALAMTSINLNQERKRLLLLSKKNDTEQDDKPKPKPKRRRQASWIDGWKND